VRPQIDFEGIPRSDRVTGLIEAECRGLGAEFPAIARCRVALHAGPADSERACAYFLRIEVDAGGRRVLIEQPCQAPRSRQMEALVAQAFAALRRRLRASSGH
jgi:hypothetical protein